MLRKKEKAKLSQAFIQKLGGGESQEGKVIVLTSGGVKEKEMKSLLLPQPKPKS